MSELKVQIKDENTLVLEEDGQVGDIINLKALHSVDESFIVDTINNKRDEVYLRMLEGVRQANINEIRLKTAELTDKFNEEKFGLLEAKRSLEQKLQTDLQQAVKDQKALEDKLNLQHQYEIDKLENLLKQIKIQTQQDVEKVFTNKLSEKERMISNLNNDVDKLKLQHQLDLSSALKKLEAALIDKEKEIEQLTRERATRSIKKIGESLESWCDEQFKMTSLYGFKTSTWDKDNQVVRVVGDKSGTKGDYIFKVYNNAKHDILLTSAMCEMKSEQLESENKKKNADHYKKLDDDRNKKGLEYAILISELEYQLESDAPIFAVAEYEKMYVVRPSFFITLLGIIESIGMKYADIITDREVQRIDFKESQDILDEFENFKKEIMDNSLRHIETQVIDISKKATTIISSANSILQSVNVIVDRHLNTVRNKIDGFSIKRVTNHIDKIK